MRRILKHLPSTLREPLLGHLGCVVCHKVMDDDDDDAKVGPSWFLSSKKSSHSVQCVAAAPTVSHLGRKMALSKVSCWDSDQLAPCTCSFFAKSFDALVSCCEKHLETVIVLKSGVHICVR